MEALGRERLNDTDTHSDLREMLKESEKIAKVSHQLSKLELSVSHRFSKLQQTRELAKGLRGMKDHADTWLTEMDKELTQLEWQSNDLSIMDSATVSTLKCQ